MGAAQSTPAGPDLLEGVSVDDIRDGGMLAGHVGEESVLLAPR
jgi:apoptosis-inducing factor 3